MGRTTGQRGEFDRAPPCGRERERERTGILAFLACNRYRAMAIDPSWPNTEDIITRIRHWFEGGETSFGRTRSFEGGGFK